MVNNLSSENASANRKFKLVASVLFVILSIMYCSLILLHLRGEDTDILSNSLDYGPAILMTELTSLATFACFAVSLNFRGESSLPPFPFGASRPVDPPHPHSLSFSICAEVFLHVGGVISFLPAVYWLATYPLINDALGPLWVFPFLPLLISLLLWYVNYDVKATTADLEELKANMYKLKGA